MCVNLHIHTYTYVYIHTYIQTKNTYINTCIYTTLCMPVKSSSIVDFVGSGRFCIVFMIVSKKKNWGLAGSVLCL